MEIANVMSERPVPFVPPAPRPREKPVGRFEMMRVVYKNPLELWGEPSYNERWISVSWFGMKTIIANDPGLIRHVLVDNAANYPMSAIRQRVLRPLLRDGLLTAEGRVEAVAKGPAPVLPRAISAALPRPCVTARSSSSSDTRPRYDYRCRP